MSNTTDESENYSVIIFPEFSALKTEVEKLRTEVSMLLAQRDELLFVECKNIEAAYMLTLGSSEYKVYKTHCDVLRLKRKLELIRARKNRGDKVDISVIEEALDIEFEEYNARLNEQIDKMNAAIRRGKCETLSDKDAKELKKTYRLVVKALHPDLHPDITEAQKELFRSAVAAYENGDLDSMRIIGAMVSEPTLPSNKENALSVLAKERNRLKSLICNIRGETEKIKNEYPYTMKALLRDEEKIAAKRAELEETLSQLKSALEFYKLKITEALG